MKITKTLEQWCIENNDKNLLEQWDCEKNKLNPSEVGFSEGKDYFWKCKFGHEWVAKPNKRTAKGRSTECLYCIHKKPSKDYNLRVVNSKLAKEWHEDNDGKPEDYLPESHERVKWKCRNNHVWEAAIRDRVEHSKCRYCRLEENNIKVKAPEIAKEWHPYLNYPNIPEQFSFGSQDYAWWRCSKNIHHNWKAKISNRTINKRGCPDCKDEKKTSFEEQAICFYLKKLFPDTKNRYVDEKENIEIDIFIPSKKIAIEYNSKYYHKTLRDKGKKDQEKFKKLLKHYKVICVQEYEEKVIGVKYIYNEEGNIETLENSIIQLIKILTDNYIISVDIKKDKIQIFNQFIKNEIPNNFAKTHPWVAKEWHRTKNLDLLPEMFTSNNNEKFWWQCSKNEEHEWSTSIYCRVHLKSGCPFCSKKQASKEYNLVTEYPDALKIWHPFLNDMTPYEVLPHSEKEVYWLKENGEITFERICNVTNRMNKLK